MENQQYSGEVNLDHPAIDDRPDGTYVYFHDLPPMLLKNRIIFTPEDPPPDEETP